jgi:hypothetical protein
MTESYSHQILLVFHPSRISNTAGLYSNHNLTLLFKNNTCLVLILVLDLHLALYMNLLHRVYTSLKYEFSISNTAVDLLLY